MTIEYGAGDDSAGCYVHLPFCDRICPYCDFAVVAYDRRRAARYLEALKKEIAASSMPDHPVRTVFLGGGTPSALEAHNIANLLEQIFTKFDIAPGSIESSLEANPSRNAADLPVWRSAGVTRLSIGVQSLDDAELHSLGRTHSSSEALAFFRAARESGFDNIGIDLIAGVPGQTLATFERSLEGVLSVRPDHVSMYGLTVEAGTPYAAWYARDPSAFPDDDTVAELLLRAHEAFTGAGYLHYELSNFAQPGHECAHNIGYWRQRECVAFGMSAAGYRAGERYRNVRDFEAYCRAIESGESARSETERLDFARRVGEAAMLALRTADGIDSEDFQRRFSIDPVAAFSAARKKCSAAGLLELDGRGARLTTRGLLLANEVCAEFLDPLLDRSTIVDRKD
jgi:oxygen-independent coproporphyrinogen-3 oxidase